MKKGFIIFSLSLVFIIMVIFASLQIDNTVATAGYDLNGKNITTQISAECSSGYSISDANRFSTKDGGYSYVFKSTCDNSKSYYGLCIDAHKQTNLGSTIVLCKNYKISKDTLEGRAIIKMYQHYIDKGGTMNANEYWALRDAMRISAWAYSISALTGSESIKEIVAYTKVQEAFNKSEDEITVEGYDSLVSEYLSVGLKGTLMTDPVDDEDYVVEAEQTSVSSLEHQVNDDYKVDVKYKISGLDKFHSSNSYAKITSIECPEGITCSITNLNENLGSLSGNETEVTVTIVGNIGAINEKLNGDSAKFIISTWNAKSLSNIMIGAKDQKSCGNTKGLQKYIFFPTDDVPSQLEVKITIGDSLNSYICNRDDGGYFLEKDNQKNYVSFKEWVQSGCCANIDDDDLKDSNNLLDYVTYCNFNGNSQCSNICDSNNSNNAEIKTWCKNNCYKCETPSTSPDFDKDLFDKNNCCNSFPDDDPQSNELCPQRKCKPDVVESTVNTCNSSEVDRNIYIHESNYYEQCIINNTDSGGDSYNISPETVNKDNAYCVVSCKEDYDFYLPTNRIDVKAGTYFFLNAGITGKRTCVSGHTDSNGQAKVGSNLEQFRKDLYGINSDGTAKDGTIEVNKSFKIEDTANGNDNRHPIIGANAKESNNYKNLKDELKNIESYESLKDFRKSVYIERGLNQLLVDAQDLYNMYKEINEIIDPDACSAKPKNVLTNDLYNNTSDCFYIENECKDCDDNNLGDYKSYEGKAYYHGENFYSFSAKGIKGSLDNGSCNAQSQCADGDISGLRIPEEEYKKVEDAISSISRLIEQATKDMQECSSWDDDVHFDFAPEIDYWYEENDYMSQVQKAIFERKTINKVDTSVINTKEEASVSSDSSNPSKNAYYCNESDGVVIDAQYSNCTSNTKGTIEYIYVECEGKSGTECFTSKKSMTAAVGTKVELSQSAVYWPKATFYTTVGNGSAVIGKGENYDISPDNFSLYLGHVFPVSIGTKAGNYEYRLGFYNIGMNNDGSLGRIVKKVDESVLTAEKGIYSLYNSSNEFDHTCGYSVKEDVCDKCVTNSTSCINCTTESDVTISSGDTFSFRPISPNNLFPNSSSGTGYLDIKTGTDKVIGSASDTSILKVSYNAPITGGVSYETNSYNGTLGSSLDKKKAGKNWANEKGSKTINNIESVGTGIYEKNPDYSFEINSTQMAELKKKEISGYEDYLVVEMDTGQKEYISNFLSLTDGKYFTWDPDSDKPSLYGFNSPNGATIRTDLVKAKTGLFQSFPGWSESDKDNGYGPSWK